MVFIFMNSLTFMRIKKKKKLVLDLGITTIFGNEQKTRQRIRNLE